MAGHEAIFKVSMRSFARFVDDFEQRRRHGSTVFHVHILESGFADIWPPESEHEGWLQAYDLPGERSLVVCEVHSPAAWPDIEPHWRDLLAELARLGLLESEPGAELPAEALTQEMVDFVDGWPVAKAAGKLKRDYYRERGISQSTFYRYQRAVQASRQCHDTAEIA